MSIYDSKSTEPSEVPVGPDEFEKDPNIGVIQNVKKMTVDGGSVRIEKGALIMSDETGIDRVLLGFLKDGF